MRTLKIEHENIAPEHLRVYEYEPDRGYLLILSGKAVDLQEARRLTNHLNTMGTTNVALLHVEEHVPLEDVARIVPIPMSPGARLWYFIKRLWWKMTRR